MLIHFFEYYVVNIILIITTLFIGEIIYQTSKIHIQHTYSKLFAKFGIGFLFLTITIALLSTGGKTFMIGLIPVVTLLLYINNTKKFNRISLKEVFNINWISIGIILSILTIVFTNKFLEIAVLSQENFQFTWGVGDKIYYTSVFNSIAFEHLESMNNQIGRIDQDFNGMTLYHYIEFWIFTPILWLTNLKAILVLELVLTSFWSVFLLLSVLSITEGFSKKDLSVFELLTNTFFFLLILYYHNISKTIDFINEMGHVRRVLFFHPLWIYKLFPILVCLLAVFRLLQSNKATSAYAILLLLPSINILEAPASLSIVVIVCFLSYIKDKNREYIFVIFSAFLIAALIIVLILTSLTKITLLSVRVELYNYQSFKLLLNDYFSLISYLIFPYILVLNFVSVPFLFFFFKLRRYLKYTLIIALFLLINFGIALALRPTTNGNQVATIFVSMIILVLTIIGGSQLITIIDNIKSKSKYLLSVILFVLFLICIKIQVSREVGFNTLINYLKGSNIESNAQYSIDFRRAVNRTLEKNPSPYLVVAFLDKKDYDDPYDIYMYAPRFLGHYLFYDNNNIIMVGGNHHLGIDNSTNPKRIESLTHTPFINFYNKGNFSSYEEAQKEFIVKNKIKFVVAVDEENLPEFIKKHDKNVIVDPISKEIFIELLY